MKGGEASVRVDDVGITCPGARAIPAIFNLFQVPFRGGEKKGAVPPPHRHRRGVASPASPASTPTDPTRPDHPTAPMRCREIPSPSY